MKFCVDMPYPKVQVEKVDIDLAKKIYSLYAGNISEDICIHSYIFQMLVVDNEDLRKILRGIAIVEMHHLEILGSLIKELGLTPVYGSFENNQLKWLSLENVRYDKVINDMLFNDIKSEEETILKYEEVINSTTDEYVRHILKRIILDERLHVEIFSKLLATFKIN